VNLPRACTIAPGTTALNKDLLLFLPMTYGQSTFSRLLKQKADDENIHALNYGRIPFIFHNHFTRHAPCSSRHVTSRKMFPDREGDSMKDV
jgi:hypothetical protein